MKFNRRWLAIAPLVVAAVLALRRRLDRVAPVPRASPARSPSGSTPSACRRRRPMSRRTRMSRSRSSPTTATANGATTLQAKIQLWNRTGKGWPDVIFSEQANDPVWMASKPFDYAAPVKGLIPAKILSRWPAPSRGQCTVNGREICVQDNLAQTVLWYDKTLMDKFGYAVPTTWQEWAALGAEGRQGASRLHHREHRRLVQPLDVPVGRPVPDQPGAEERQRPHQLDGFALHPDGQPARSADQERDDAAGEHLHAGLRPEVRRSRPEGPDDAGTDVVREGRLQRHAKIPAGHMAAAMPLRWNGESPITTGQIGGGPWIISRHSKNLAAAGDFVTWVTTSPVVKDKGPGYPSYAPAATRWLANLGKDPYFAASPAKPLQAAARSHLEGLEHGHVSGPARLVEHRRHATCRRQVAELPAAGARRRARTGRAGGWLQGRQAMTT